MRALAREGRVLWVESLGNRSPRVSGRDLGRLARKAARAAGGVKEVEKNLHVLSPLALPYFDPAARAANRLIVGTQVRVAMARLSFSRPISWSFLPAAAPVAGRIGESFVVYHCVDDFSAFTGTPPVMTELEADLCRRADLVVASAERLAEKLRPFNEETILVRHGVDHAHFARALDPATPLAAELAGLPKPILGFFGLIADWVDVELLARVAERFSAGSLVLVGAAATDAGAVRARPNVHLLGRRPYADLPGFCKGFDIALLPFRRNALTLAANPLKVREYLAAGLPVVATAIPEVESLGLCRVAGDAASFLDQIEAALADRPGPRPERSAAMAGESWESRLAEIQGHVARVMVERGAKG